MRLCSSVAEYNQGCHKARRIQAGGYQRIGLPTDSLIMILSSVQFISPMKSIIQHFSKSSFSTTKLHEARNVAGNDEPVKALQKIGKTRFGTYWLASTALDPCLSAIRELVGAKVMKFKVDSSQFVLLHLSRLIIHHPQNTKVQGMFLSRHNSKYIEFEKGILQYNSIVAPMIRSLWSLEAAHANASDVFLFWLAAAATLDDLFSKGEEENGIPLSLANNITEIYNKRYEEFFANDLYFTAFLLDPRLSFILLLIIIGLIDWEWM